MNLSKKVGLEKKIYLTVLISGLFAVLVVIAVFMNVRSMLQLQSQVQKSQLRMNRFGRLENLMIDMETGVRGFMLSGDASYLEPYNSAEEKFEEYVRQSEGVITDDVQQMERFKTIVRLKKEWIEGPAINEMMAKKKVLVGKLSQDEFVQLFKSSNGKGIIDEIRKKAWEAIADEEKRIQFYQLEVESRAKRIVLLSFLTILCVLLAFGSIALVSRKISHSISNLIQILGEITDSLGNVADQLTKTSRSLYEGVQTQQASVQSAASSVQQISALADKTHSNAINFEIIASMSESIASEGKASMSEMSRAIGDINSSNIGISGQVEKSNQKIAQVFDIISAIGQKVGVINDIVLQTKLLSFNASVEAARAGEHGKGFAVVANEITNLANSSGSAAKEINDMLHRGLAQVQQVIDESKSEIELILDESEIKINSGMKIAHRCEEILDKMMANASLTLNSVTEISSATSNQTSGLAEVNQAVFRIDQLAGENKQISESEAKLAQDLSLQAAKLKNVVSLLSIDIKGE